MATLTTADAPTGRRATRTLRSATFRLLAILWAAVLIVMFGMWQAIASPWVVVDDGADHGWLRTPELHRLADSAAAAIMVAVAVGAIILAIRPIGRSGLAAWVAGSLALFGLLSPVSSMIQGQDVVAGVITGVVWLGLTAVTFLLAYPEARAVWRGGSSEDRVPTPRVRAVLTVGASLGVTLAVGAVVWRLAGGVFESPLEDDVISFVNLGLSFALGCWLSRSGRAGWRVTALILAGVALYAVAGGVSLALT